MLHDSLRRYPSEVRKKYEGLTTYMFCSHNVLSALILSLISLVAVFSLFIIENYIVRKIFRTLSDTTLTASVLVALSIILFRVHKEAEHKIVAIFSIIVPLFLAIKCFAALHGPGDAFLAITTMMYWGLVIAVVYHVIYAIYVRPKQRKIYKMTFYTGVVLTYFLLIAVSIPTLQFLMYKVPLNLLFQEILNELYIALILITITLLGYYIFYMQTKPC